MGSKHNKRRGHVDSAIKVLRQTEADASKLKTYCEMTKTMEAVGAREDAATDAKISERRKAQGRRSRSAAPMQGRSIEIPPEDVKAKGK